MNVVEIGRWLQDQGRAKQPVGMQSGRATIILSDGIDTHPLLVDEAARGMLANVLGGTYAPDLVVWSMPEAVVRLAALTDLPPRVLVDRIAGDMEALDYTIGSVSDGRPDYMVRSFKAAQQTKLPDYYRRIAVPRQRLRSLPLADGPQFRVSYSHLFAKTVARYSGEPALIQRNDLGDPVDNLVTEDLSYDDARAQLEQAALDGVPDDDTVARLLPLVALQTTQTFQRALQEGEARTLYGRRMSVTGETTCRAVMEHTLLGSVQDIINVAAVTFANQGASVALPVVTGLETRIRILGTVQHLDNNWWRTLIQLASLGSPLTPVTLDPVIIAE